MSVQPASVRHGTGCSCYVCDRPELVAATDAGDLELEQSGRLDPTGTTSIQRELARFLRGRINSLNSDVRDRIVEEDVFGLGDTDGEFAGMPREAQLNLFDEWLEGAAQKEVVEELDTDRVRDWFVKAATAGIRDGHTDLNEFGVETDDPDDVLGQDVVQEQIEERHAELEERVGVAVEDYRSDVRNILAAGLLAGVARRQLASDITERAKVYDSHVTAQAAGEIVNQYNTTQLTSYDRVDPEIELETEVEYVDAGDDRVCEHCLELSARDWTLEEAQAEDPIPVHDYCRCRFRVEDVRELF